MAIPLLFLIPAGAAALYGAVKGVGAVIDHSDANDKNADAQSIVRKANEKLDQRREATNEKLIEYGQRKARTLEGSVELFINTFGQLKNVELENSPALDRLYAGQSPEVTLCELRKDYQMVVDTSLGLGTGAASGAALAFGAYNGTMLLAKASTGTAIYSLSGAAATNATLAWLGGGSIASGGGGIALGTTVLGAMAMGPALAIAGHIMGNKAEEALANASANHESARKFAEETDLVCEKLAAITQVTHQMDRLLSMTGTKLRKASHNLERVIERAGTDYATFDAEAKATTFTAVKYAQLVKLLIDTPILDEKGNLLPTAKQKADEIATALPA